MKTPGIQHQRLSAFAGTWKTEGTLLAASGQPETSIKGSDRYEWLPGGFFLLHTANVMMGENRSQTTEIIGMDEGTGDYFMQYYNNTGESGKMTANCKGDAWTFRGDDLRFKGSFRENGTVFSGMWEQRKEGNSWVPFINIKLIKENTNQISAS